jgi:pullulanase/glycogen debranching enzyme
MAHILHASEVVAASATDFHSIVLELRSDPETEIDAAGATLLPGTPDLPGDREIQLSPIPREPTAFARKSAYFRQRDEIVFLLPESRVKFLSVAKDPIFLAADFNNWFDGTKSPKFALKFTPIDGQNFFALPLPMSSLPGGAEFKFVSASGIWFDPEIDAPNRAANSTNYYFDGTRTGRHLITLQTGEPMSIADKFFIKIGDQTQPVDTLPWLLACYTDAELGVKVANGVTTFRVFMPRAHSARVLIYKNLCDEPKIIAMERRRDNTWMAEINANLHGQFYHYQALFCGETDWDRAPKILDPYARATCSHSGPGVILSERTFLPLRDNFVPHPMENGVIVEAHVRDLLKNAPIRLNAEQRLQFNGLSKWLSKRHCYLRRLGINAVEFQPITESDARDKSEYHWGYMPVNFFSPASAYSSSPAKAPAEFKALVKACHRAGLAVILDVVYNHTGEQQNFQNIDRDYFFRKNDDGSLQNFSGCGNDLRTESPMVQRMILDSLVHFIKAYNVDGFRFDLAELLGKEFLCGLERELRLVKRDLQIIYEPWSFRGDIGKNLHNFSGSAWNDEYRDFLPKYVRGEGNFDGIRYFLGGSLGFRSAFTHQSINYVESHDDLCWLDKITENWHHNGTNYTDNDRRRTHLALAILMASLGVPMLHAGQDMLQSKRGIGNTYQLGGVNALDYNLLAKNQATHKFFRRWIKFRLSKRGAALRPPFTPPETYLKFFRSPETSAIGILYNADLSLRARRLFFAINPHFHDCSLELNGLNLGKFRQLSNGERFFNFARKFNSGKTFSLGPLSLALCIE